MYIRGKIKHNNSEMKFIFEGDTLEIIFDKLEDVKEISNINLYDKGLFISGNESLEISHLIGYSNNGIYEFYITSSRLTFDNSFICKVGYYAVYWCKDYNKYNERRLLFACPELDAIFNCGSLYSFVYNSKMRLKSVNFEEFINTNPQDHKFSVAGVNYNIKINNKLTSKNNDKIPLVLGNDLYLYFDKYSSIDDIYSHYVKIKALIAFLYNRRNIYFNEVLIYGKENETYQKIGEFVVLESNKIVDEVDDNKCIKYNDIVSEFTLLASRIFSDDIHTNHLPSSLNLNKIFTAGSFIILLAAFEFEFNKYYVVKHSNQTISAREEVNKTVDSLIASSSGKVKNMFNNFKKHIDDEILSSKILYLFKIMPDEMKKLGERIYVRNELKFDKNTIAKRIEKQRNDFAHGNIKEEFTRGSLADYLFLERIVYFIQLINLGVKPDKSIEMINKITIG